MKLICIDTTQDIIYHDLILNNIYDGHLFDKNWILQWEIDNKDFDGYKYKMLESRIYSLECLMPLSKFREDRINKILE